MIAKQRRPAPPVARARQARDASGFCRAMPPAPTRARSAVQPISQSIAHASRARRSSLPPASMRAARPVTESSVRVATARAIQARRSACDGRIRVARARRAAHRPPARARCRVPRRLAPRATTLASSADGCGAAASGNAKRSSAQGARARSVRESDKCRAAVPRASSAAHSPPPAFIRSAGAMTATFARWRWLVSCDEFDQRAHAVDGDRVDLHRARRRPHRSSAARAA